MKINPAYLKFKEPFEELHTIEKLVIHHTSRTSMNIYEAHKFHQNERGWSGVGYNYFIEKSGAILEGRGLHVGAHVYGYNRNTLGICVTGDFDYEYPNAKQIDSLTDICMYLLDKFSLPISAIVGHRDLNSQTTCPGKHFDIETFKRHLIETKL